MPSAEIGDEGSGPTLNFCLLRIISSNWDEGLEGRDALLWVTGFPIMLPLLFLRRSIIFLLLQSFLSSDVSGI